MTQGLIEVPVLSRQSRWRTRVADARPDLGPAIARLASARIGRPQLEGEIATERGAGWRDDAHLRSGLRRVRTRVIAALIDRDLARTADLVEVMDAMSALAELAIGEALDHASHALAARHGVPRGRDSDAAQDLIVIGMGKLGGGELNVSSDIDLVFVYDEDGETIAAESTTAARPISNQEFFTALGRRLIATLSEVTADGFVFRVDMRLRPDGGSGPLVASFAMLENYLVSSARDWERFAWIKARIVSPPIFVRGGPAMEPTLSRLVTPFVYRRYLDFGAIDALRKLHGQIRDEAARREASRNGRVARYVSGHPPTTAATPGRIDVKLGRGGIREIEFIVQHFQLIRGGREPALRLRPTLAVLDQLARDDLITDEVCARLREAYVFLRDVEHRLQYLDDAQTHSLPARDAADDCARIAAMCAPLIQSGAALDFDDLIAALEAHRAFVSAQFDAVFGLAPEPPSFDPATLAMGAAAVWAAFSDAIPLHVRDPDTAALVRERLVAISFDPPDTAFARLAALGQSARLRGIPSSTRARIDALVPRLIESARHERDPGATLARWFDLVEAIAGRSAYLALLEEFPVARRSVTRLLSASPWAAQYLTRHPLLLDDLVTARDADRPGMTAAEWDAHAEALARLLADRLARAAPDTERQMDVLRESHHAETFRLLIDDLEGRLSVEALSDRLSALADLTVQAAIDACWAALVAGGGFEDMPARDPAFAVIAYGKLGGKELGYASDLDLVFLFDERGAADPSVAIQRYARFAQRLVSWLTARTTAGALFEVDLRLRPDGAAGLIVTSFEAWARYERRTHDMGAWTWEHQALTRARAAAGDRRLGAAFEEERRAILAARTPDEARRKPLCRDVVAMRARMHDGHPNRSGLFDLKHDPGGMVDIEFCVQYLVLAYGGRHPELLDNAGNIALLARAAAAGLIDAQGARQAADAYRVYRARQHAVRLADPTAPAARVEAEAYPDERAAVRRLWAALFDQS